MSRSLRALLLVALVCGPKWAVGQERPDAPAVSSIVWSGLEASMADLRDLGGRVPDFTASSSVDCGFLAPEEAEALLYSARARARDRDVGLGVEAGLRTDFEDQRLDEGLPGAYVGLSWELLQAGLLESRRSADLFAIRSEAAELEAEVASNEAAIRCAAVARSVAFRPFVSSLLQRQISILETVSSLMREAYLSGYGDLEDVLGAEEALVSARARLEALRSPTGPEFDGVPPVEAFPAVVDLDLTALESRALQARGTRGLVELREREVRLSRRLESRTRLRLYGRYGLRPNESGPDERGFSGGVIFRMPLFQGSGAGLEHELEAVRRSVGFDEGAFRERVRSAHGGFRDRLETAIRSHYAVLEQYEAGRRALAARALEPSGGEVGAALEAVVELQGAVQAHAVALHRLYDAASGVFIAAGERFDVELLTPLSLPGPDHRARAGSRALYVWSSSFERYSNGYLVELARSKGFDRVVVSNGRGVDAEKASSFTRAARDAGVVVEALLSTNAWLDPERRDGVGERISALAVPDGGVHLDIEPQMLDAFDEAPDSLLDAYVDVVRRARTALGESGRLSIAVPIWWPAPVYERLDPLVDRVYLMAYGERDPVRVVERLTPVLAGLDAGKSTLVLRAADFETEWAMDVVFRYALEQTGLDRTAVHDLEGFMTLLGSDR